LISAIKSCFCHANRVYLAPLKAPEKKLIVIVGPTAVGKTAIAIQLAAFFNSPVISADSRQIFKEMNIGTAKPTGAELSQIKHYFINTNSIHESYDAAQYGRDALQLIKLLFETHDTLILCGGSGLYIRAVCEGFDDIPEVSSEIREDLTLNYSRFGLSWLQNKLKELDPDHFETIDQQNPQRIMRALEVKIGTGSSISSFRGNSKLMHDFNIVKIGLELPRELLYQRIDERMDSMIEQGLFEEAQKLYAFRNHNALQTVGYQEIFDLIDGQYDREEAVRLLKRNTRHYAKRQLTWFKKDQAVTWFQPESFNDIVNFIDSNKEN
jgi:tRNA dimethylallyltransferase